MSDKTIKAYHTPLDADEIFAGWSTKVGVEIYLRNFADMSFEPAIKSEKMINIPFYAYIHGGCAFSFSPYGCRFDSAMCGHLRVPADMSEDDVESYKSWLVYDLERWANNDNYVASHNDFESFSGTHGELADFADEQGYELELVY